MKQAQLNKYCDEVLTILYRNTKDDPLLFGVGEFRTGEKLSDDLFVKIKLSEDDTKTIIQTLEGDHKFIETITKEKNTYYDLAKKANVNSAIFAVKLTDAGRYFVETSSFAREARRRSIDKWIPGIPNIMAMSAMIIAAAAVLISRNESAALKQELVRQREDILQQKNELLQQKEQLLLQIQATRDSLLFKLDSTFKHLPAPEPEYQ